MQRQEEFFLSNLATVLEDFTIRTFLDVPSYKRNAKLNFYVERSYERNAKLNFYVERSTTRYQRYSDVVLRTLVHHHFNVQF